MRHFENDTSLVTLLLHPAGGAELRIYDKTRPDWLPFVTTYEWHQRRKWEHDLDVLIGAYNLKEIEHAA